MFSLCSYKAARPSSAFYRLLHQLLQHRRRGLEDEQIGAGKRLDRAGFRRLHFECAATAGAELAGACRVIKNGEKPAGRLRAETDVPIAGRDQAHGDHSEHPVEGDFRHSLPHLICGRSDNETRSSSVPVLRRAPYPVVTASRRSEGSISWFNPAASLSRSSSPSQAETTIAATPLPQMLVSARHSLMNLSMPSTIAMPGTSSGRTAASVPASVMKPAPVIPEAPLEVSMATMRIVICSPKLSDTPSACAMNSVANVI